MHIDVLNPYESHAMRTGYNNNLNNPMLNRNKIHVPEVAPGTSQWMKDFNRAFGTSLNAGMAIGVAPIVAPIFAETLSSKFIANGIVSSTVNAVSQYSITGEIDVFDVGAAFVFNKPFGGSLFGYSITSGLFDYSTENQSLRSPFLGNKDAYRSAAEIFSSSFLAGSGGQMSKLFSNTNTQVGINSGFSILNTYIFHISPK